MKFLIITIDKNAIGVYSIYKIK